jgi:hypothetical protein
MASNLLYTDCEVYPRLSCDNAAVLHGRGKFAKMPKAIENRRIEIVLAFMWPLDHERCEITARDYTARTHFCL